MNINRNKIKMLLFTLFVLCTSSSFSMKNTTEKKPKLNQFALLFNKNFDKKTTFFCGSPKNKDGKSFSLVGFGYAENSIGKLIDSKGNVVRVFDDFCDGIFSSDGCFLYVCCTYRCIKNSNLLINLKTLREITLDFESCAYSVKSLKLIPDEKLLKLHLKSGFYYDGICMKGFKKLFISPDNGKIERKEEKPLTDASLCSYKSYSKLSSNGKFLLDDKRRLIELSSEEVIQEFPSGIRVQLFGNLLYVAEGKNLKVFDLDVLCSSRIGFLFSRCGKLYRSESIQEALEFPDFIDAKRNRDKAFVVNYVNTYIVLRNLSMMLPREVVAYIIGFCNGNFEDKIDPELMRQINEKAIKEDIVAGRIVNLIGDLLYIDDGKSLKIFKVVKI